VKINVTTKKKYAGYLFACYCDNLLARAPVVHRMVKEVGCWRPSVEYLRGLWQLSANVPKGFRNTLQLAHWPTFLPDVGVPWWIIRPSPPHLDTMTHWPALSNNVTIRPKNVFILWHSDPCGSDCPATPKPHNSTPQKWVEWLAVTFQPVSQHCKKISYSLFCLGPVGQCRTPIDGAHKNSTVPPDRTPPMHGSDGRVS
jgi:hypothetical protein